MIAFFHAQFAVGCTYGRYGSRILSGDQTRNISTICSWFGASFLHLCQPSCKCFALADLPHNFL